MAADFESSHISSRMRDTILSISPRIDAALATKSACIDLATAENWLLRSELRNIYSASIAGHIKEKASFVHLTPYLTFALLTSRRWQRRHFPTQAVSWATPRC